MVIELAIRRGWLCLHLRPARTAHGWRTAVAGHGVGWPDLFLVKGARAIAAELKVGKRKATPQQLAWLAALEAAGITTYLWTAPQSWPEIERVLGEED